MILASSTRFSFCALVLSLLELTGCSLFRLYPPGPVTKTFQCPSIIPDYVAPTCTSQTIPAAIKCAEDTRNLFAQFLYCREQRQLGVGVAIAVLAAAAASVAAAGESAVAATALGGTAGSGLALTYVTQNKEKTKAYADAMTQLQCTISESTPLQDLLVELKNIDSKYICLDIERNSKASKTEKEETSQIWTKYKLAKERENVVQIRLSQLGQDIFSTVQTIDVRAFAASQKGIPDADQIQKAVQSVSGSIPKLPELPKQNPGNPISPCSKELVEEATRKLSGILDAIQLPKPGFPECLALKAYDESSGNSSDKSSSTSPSTSDDKGSEDGKKKAADKPK